MNNRIRTSLLILACFGVGVGLSACNDDVKLTEAKPVQHPIIEMKDGQKVKVGVYTVPQDTEIDKEPNADEIRYGARLLTETKRLLPDNVGDDINCNSCHIAGGKVAETAPYINTYNAYPMMNPRAGREVNLVERINGCFQRSMNGKPIDPEGKEMKAMIAYMKWLGQGVPKGQKVAIKNAYPINTKLVADPIRGKTLYEKNCAVCHGMNGEGKRDGTGTIAFPPLWGDHSFNIGAGMARTYKAAAFLKTGMPMGIKHDGVWGQGGLSDQDVVDIAEYFTHQDRPDFPGKVNDWPNGKKPKDARY